jgi:hypothetical protein
MMPRPHDRFSSTITLTPEAVRVYARAAGETTVGAKGRVLVSASP